ncbi:MAG: hypothetical protein ACE5OZ_06435 [Candidatus Heimdallarchaeota archaeon]
MTDIFEQADPEGMYLSLFKLGGKGPELVFGEKIPGMENNQKEFATKIGVFYLTALGQGESFNTGLFGPLPLPRTSNQEASTNPVSNFEALAYAFFINDPTNEDPRIVKTYSIIVAIIPKTLTECIYHRKGIEMIFDNEISQFSVIQEISVTALNKLKTRLQIKFREAGSSPVI